ncbi:hypothetical protein [Methanorbis furvi]
MINNVNNVRVVYRSDIDRWKDRYPLLIDRVMSNVDQGKVIILEGM